MVLQRSGHSGLGTPADSHCGTAGTGLAPLLAAGQGPSLTGAWGQGISVPGAAAATVS